MTQYIDKSALVSEIKRRIDENRGKQTLPQYFGMVEEDLNILSFIDTLEVKEVDLDDKGEWKNTGGFGSTWDPDSPDYCPY